MSADLDSVRKQIDQLRSTNKYVQDIVQYCTNSYFQLKDTDTKEIEHTTRQYVYDTANSVAEHVLLVSTSLTGFLKEREADLRTIRLRMDTQAFRLQSKDDRLCEQFSTIQSGPRALVGNTTELIRDLGANPPKSARRLRPFVRPKFINFNALDHVGVPRSSASGLPAPGGGLPAPGSGGLPPPGRSMGLPGPVARGPAPPAPLGRGPPAPGVPAPALHAAPPPLRGPAPPSSAPTPPGPPASGPPPPAGPPGGPPGGPPAAPPGGPPAAPPAGPPALAFAAQPPALVPASAPPRGPPAGPPRGAPPAPTVGPPSGAPPPGVGRPMGAAAPPPPAAPALGVPAPPPGGPAPPPLAPPAGGAPPSGPPRAPAGGNGRNALLDAIRAKKTLKKTQPASDAPAAPSTPKPGPMSMADEMAARLAKRRG